MPDPIVCDGRSYTDDGQPVGPPCGKKLAHHGYRSTDGGRREATTTELHERARAAGWRIGPNGQAMCPACARPDPATLAAIRQL